MSRVLAASRAMSWAPVSRREDDPSMALVLDAEGGNDREVGDRGPHHVGVPDVLIELGQARQVEEPDVATAVGGVVHGVVIGPDDAAAGEHGFQGGESVGGGEAELLENVRIDERPRAVEVRFRALGLRCIAVRGLERLAAEIPRVVDFGVLVE
jgi:hypothetical protein